jgi:hypothetical protein
MRKLAQHSLPISYVHRLQFFELFQHTARLRGVVAICSRSRIKSRWRSDALNVPRSADRKFSASSIM